MARKLGYRAFLIFGFVFCMLANRVLAQVVTTSPAFPVANQPVTITVDVTGTSLDKFAWNNDTNPVWIWTWIKKTGSPDADAPTNVNPATAGQDAAKCTRISTNPDKYQITFTPTTFFNKAAADIPRIGLKLKTRNWSDNKQTDVDKFIDFSSGFNASFAAPTESVLFKNTGDVFPITVNASESATLTLKINGATAATQTGTSLTYNQTVTETSGTTQVVCEAVAGAQNKTISFSYTIRTATINQSRPAGIKDGINYSTDPTKVTLGLWAPGKSSVYVIGDFNNWSVNANYQMKKSGEHFWLEVTGLTAGTEYAFQYLVDETLRIADPYADKILDPDDQSIPVATYPSLKAFPEKALTDKWYFNRLSVLQTNQQPYQWQATNYQKPAKEKLVIYELHIRDFFGTGKKNYQSLIDTISYFKRLGVNAIELMPITEFSGNDSWGYNPNFMFAPDKFYGTKNKLKEFIDKCHQNGIAVILDVVMNQQDLPNSYLMMDFNFTTFKPTANNRWFNVDATHPFNVFFDMNHESPYTKTYLDTINHYWLNEYKMDGYRFDLSKGFTQTNNPNNVGAWGAYDASRIAILKRMADKIWAHTPNAYVILEHFADNSEEKELAEYKSSEGKGMMLWSNFHKAFSQLAMGYASESDIGGLYFANRSFSVPGAVGYMESHDEERLVYNNLQNGASSGTYNTKTLATALDRIKATSVIFYTTPGPKMLWQFGELGYDKSINTCSDGTTISNDCRTSAKPIKWDYQQDALRSSLFNHIANLISLRKKYAVFTNGDATLTQGSGLAKQISIKNKPFTATPTTTDQMNAVAVANFNLSTQTISINFSHAGTWYDYYNNNQAITVGSTSLGIELQPGQYKLFTDVRLADEVVTGVEEDQLVSIELFPNPTSSLLKLKTNQTIVAVSAITAQGAKVQLTKIDQESWDMSSMATGLYLLEIQTVDNVIIRRVIKK
jgi:1,4-alpha-glucan branching enzyme